MTDQTKEQIKQLISLAKTIIGVSSSRQLGLKAKISPSTITRAEEENPLTTMSTPNLTKLHACVRAHVLSGTATTDQISLYENSYKALEGSGMVPAHPAPQSTNTNATPPDSSYTTDFPTDPRTIPVMGTAAGSALGSFEIGSDIIDRVRCPPNLVGVKGIYGIVVVGESMVPEHKPGDLRIIHPGRPPQPGDSVVIQTYNAETDTREAFIKILVKANGKEVKCRQHNPPMEITYIQPNGDPEKNNGKQTYVLKVHKVLTVNELHGF